MYGFDVAALNVYTRTFAGGPLTLVWNQKGSRGDEWLRARIELKVQQPFQVLIEGVRGAGYEGDIGVDDTSFTPGCQIQSLATLPPFYYSTTSSPYCNSTHSHCLQNTRQCLPKDQFCNFNIECTDQTDELSCPWTCTFEQQTLCQWFNDPKGKLKWSFGSGRTTSSDTGPDTDHTLHSINGTYIYLETSVGISGDRARLISPIYQKSSKTCMFVFWYHMLGDTIDTLNIYVRAADIDTLVWTLKGDQGKEWLQGIAYLPTCASEFSIIVEGVRGASFTGDIALDDFRFEECYERPPLPNTCQTAISDPNQFLCQSKHCIPKENTCDFELDCCDRSDEDEFVCYAHDRCDFEQSFCSWEHAAGSQLFWERYRADAAPFQRRPPYDHTKRTGLGHFLEVRTNATISRGTPALLSTVLAPITEQGCSLRFWFYLKGDDGGQLSVGFRYAIGDTIVGLPITYQPCSSNETQCIWQRISVSLSSVLTQPTEFIIGVTTGANRDAIMAIDDISFTPACKKFNGTVPTRPPTTPYTGPSTTTTTTGTADSSAQSTSSARSTTPARECLTLTCFNGGICKPSSTQIGQEECQCKPGFNGAQCQNKVKPKSSSLGTILGSVFGAIAVVALIIIVIVFVRPKILAARNANAHTRLLDSLPIGPITNPAYSETTTSDA